MAKITPSAGYGTRILARAAGRRDEASGQELSLDEVRMHAALVTAAKDRELGAWKKFKVPKPVRAGTPSKLIPDTRWVLTWKMAEGAKYVTACLVAKGYQDCDLETGLVETSGSVSLRSSHL